MFRAARHWWSEGSRQKAARLFLFELLVVILGVLIAQWLADLNAERQAYRQMEQARAKSERELGYAAASALAWKEAIPCIDARMTSIMQANARAIPIPPDHFRRPSLGTVRVSLPSDSEYVLLANRYGDAIANAYGAASRNGEDIGRRTDRIADEWGGLTMIDPANGPATAMDRYEARRAASAIKGVLRGLAINADNIVRRAKSLGISPVASSEWRPIRDCDDLWRTGMTHPRSGIS